MIVEIASPLWPSNLTIDTDARGPGGPHVITGVAVRLAANEPPLVSWGDTDPSRAPAFLAIVGIAVLLTFALVGMSKS